MIRSRRSGSYRRRSRQIATSILIALISASVIALAWRALRARRQPLEAPNRPSAPSEAAVAPEPAPYSDEVIDGVYGELFRIAFGVARFDYQIMGEHASVLARVDETVVDSVQHREYFPRRPMLLPRLLQTLNDEASSRDALVQLILEDPALAGNVLKLANSAFYRLSPEPVESLDRAVVILGADGLRNLIATAIMQPVFRLPKGFFDNFASLTWEQAQRTAAAAEATAKSERNSDPFVAQLLGLLTSLARLVIFRLTLERYREQPNILPRAEVFIRAMQKHAPKTARLIGESWELSQSPLLALDEQAQRVPPGAMSPLGRAVYFGELGGALGLLHRRGVHSADGAKALLRQQELSDRALDAVWRAATASDEP